MPPADEPPGRATVDSARSRLLEEHRDLVVAALDAAEDVASGWDHDHVVAGDAVVEPLRNELDRRGIVDRLPAVVVDVVEDVGYELPAEPVAAPPYVVVTSTGPLLRATVSDGRLVIELRLFAVERDPVRYRLRDGGPDGVVDVSFVRDDSVASER